MKITLPLLAVSFLLSGMAYAQETIYPTPPSPAKPRTVVVPKPVETRLANGLRVISIARPGSGLVSLVLLSPFGATNEPAAENGLASTTAELLTKGTKTRSATQIADATEQLGASIGASAGFDSISVSLSVLKTRLPEAATIFADVIRNPTFPVAELNRYRAQTIDELSVSYRSPGALARLVAARTLYGTFPYGNPVVGTPQTLPKIQRTDLVGYHKKAFQPKSLTLIVTGDITAAEVTRLAKQLFGSWIPASVPVNRLSVSPKTQEARRILVIDRPDAGQSAVVISRMGISQAEPNPVIPELTNDILGGGYSSRLNREVRVKRGLSYGAGSRLDARKFVGPLSLAAQTKNETAGEAAQVMVEELAKLGSAPPSAEEFAARKSALSGDFARSLETGAGLAGLVGQLALYNRPLTELQTYLAKVQAVTPDQVESFAKSRFDAKEANVVIVGNAAKFLPDLKTRFPGEEVTVIPFAQLDLNKASLIKGGK